MISRVIAKNVGDVFFETQCSYPLKAFIRHCNCARERLFAYCLTVVEQCSSLTLSRNAHRHYNDALIAS